jgi:broad specificity phosphatase PhoE
VAATWVYLIRHGAVRDAERRRFFGHTDVPLSPTGLAQVQALGVRLGAEGIEAVYASDLLRARQSAAPLAAARALAPVTLPALREVAMGRWEGLTFEEIRAREPALCDRWLADPATVPFPEGESLADLRARALPAWRALLERHAGGRIAIVAHGGTNRVILGDALGVPPGNLLRLAQDYAGWSLLEWRRGQAIVHAVNRRVSASAWVTPVEATLGRPAPA